MTLVSCVHIKSQQDHPPVDGPVLQSRHSGHEFAGRADQILKKHLGHIDMGATTHFVTLGRWSMHDLLFYVLRQTGPADVDVATWSISEDAIRQIVNLHSEGLIKTIRFILDPRVKVRNPKPLQMLSANFPFKLAACHAKVTLIRNLDHQISIVSSANMTGNPRIERGCIFPFPDVYKFDKNWIDETFARTE